MVESTEEQIKRDIFCPFVVDVCRHLKMKNQFATVAKSIKLIRDRFEF